MQHEVERGPFRLQMLDELGDRDVVLGERRGRVPEHARLVGDIEMDVERGSPAGGVEPRQLPPARVVLQEPRPGRADDADEVGDDGGRRLDPSGAGAAERDLANCVPLQDDDVRASLDARKRVRVLDKGGLHANVDRAVDERRDADQL